MSESELAGDTWELNLDLPELTVSYSTDESGSVVECAVNANGVITNLGVQNLASGPDSPWDQWWASFLQGGILRRPECRSTLRVADLFSGPGGLSLGVGLAAQALGFCFDSVLAVDVDGGALGVHAANHGTRHTYNGSAKDLVDFRVVGRHSDAKFAYHPEPLGDFSGQFEGALDVIVAGPPCQGHSTLNNYSRGRDPRNRLFLTVPALAVAWRVPTVIIENVPAVVRDSEGVVQSAESLFRRAGYSVSTAVLQAHKLGWPQTRKRFFMVASRGASIPLAQVAAALLESTRPVSWALNDLLGVSASNVLWDGTPNLSPENEARVAHLFEEGEYDLPLHKRPDSHKNGTTYTSVYGRMHWDKPSGTITTGFLTPGRGRFIHPLEPRVLTPHEAARLQGFPDTFNFFPGPARRQDLGKWIGDAVPSILGFGVGLGAFARLSR